MLENVPKIIGHALSGVRAGLDKTVSRKAEFADAPATIELSSPAFADHAPMPARFTADGDKVSPPLAWRNVPETATALVLIVEDADAPGLEPLVHCIVLDLAPGNGALPEAGLKSGGATGQGHALGKNSYLKPEYLPPDPPTGHGTHRYVFQLFALDRHLELPEEPGRGAVLDAMRGHVLATGVLVGTYERI